MLVFRRSTTAIEESFTPSLLPRQVYYGKSINPIASKLTKSESFVMWESEGDPSDIFAIQSLMDPLSENAKECLRIVTIRF